MRNADSAQFGHLTGATVVVGRQAIVDTHESTVGYELLFRSVDGSGPGASMLSSDAMTDRVLYGALNIGLDYLVDGKTIFCNADRGLLVGAMPLTLPPAQTVIEVLETVLVDADVLAGCRRLRRAGYGLALDDFEWFDGAEQLLALATIVKIDVQAVQGAELTDLVARCAGYDVRLLAEKVETREELEQYRALGFVLFQGYAIEHPQIMSRHIVEPGELSKIELAAALTGSDFDLDQLEEILRGEPGLTHQILRLAAVGQLGETLRRVNDIRHALVLLGSRRIQNWVSLLLVHSSGPASYDHLLTALVRARACELLAPNIPPVGAQTAFAAGMISSFDSLLGISTAELSRSLPLTEELRSGAFGGDTPLGAMVQDVIDYQTGRSAPRLLSGIDPDDLDPAFADAFTWAVGHAATIDA